MVDSNFGARRILSLCLKTELNSVFGGGVGACLAEKINQKKPSSIPAAMILGCAELKFKAVTADSVFMIAPG